ncbi:leucyl aminopeptidase [bacterium]|nr:leucyl aminopeptidase [bacterium]
MAVKMISRSQITKTENIALGVVQDKPATDFPGSITQELKEIRKLGDFKGKAGELIVLYPKGQKTKRIFVCGLGKAKAIQMDVVRKAVFLIMKKAVKLKLKELVFDADSFIHKHTESRAVIQTIVLMGGLAAYTYTENKSGKHQKTQAKATKLILAGSARSDLKGICEQGAVIAEAVNYARILADRPANQLYPQSLANEAKRLSRLSAKLSVKVMQKPELIRKGFGALLAVGVGSQRSPVLIELNYRGSTAGKAPIALVGKGITFDSGGISLKPSNKMDEMRYDMSGAATVLGIFKAATQLRLPVNLIGVIPAAENMPSGSAARPGDIVKSLSGKKIEILNTDAEGRLILADGITYVKKHKPTSIIDFATLTGAVIVALGHAASGLISNNQKLADEIIQAGNVSGEKVWQLPLWDEYRDLVKSENADVANIGNKPGAGTIVGGAFLEKFVENTPWVHLDIAGTAWGEAGLIFNKGATGVGVRLILEWLKKIK